MDYKEFDRRSRALGAAATRRLFGRGLAGGGIGALAGALGIFDVNAKQKRGKKKNKKRRGQGTKSVPTSPPPPGSVLTYQCPGPKNFLVSIDGNTRFAQTFTAER